MDMAGEVIVSPKVEADAIVAEAAGWLIAAVSRAAVVVVVAEADLTAHMIMAHPMAARRIPTPADRPHHAAAVEIPTVAAVVEPRVAAAVELRVAAEAVELRMAEAAVVVPTVVAVAAVRMAVEIPTAAAAADTDNR
jgi:hypothetical protein